MEIGSDFLKESKREQYFLSGRTALDSIAKELKKVSGLDRILLPSYCCSTMIQPFITNEFKVRFYDINVGEDGILRASLPDPMKNEVIYLMKYFGSSSIKGVEESVYHQWSMTIEDLTHSCFSQNYDSQADYSFESYHKWFGVNGIALARKKDASDFYFKPYRENLTYEKLRTEAFLKKENYFKDHSGSKMDYLNLFSRASEELNHNYSGYRPSMDSIILLDKFRRGQVHSLKKRKENADFLLNSLKDLPFYKVMVNFNTTDVPLFVPISVPESFRDSLKMFLIEEEVYCPSHWPISHLHPNFNQSSLRVYQEELSLVCDQRYSVKEMERILHTLEKFYISKVRNNNCLLLG